MLLNKKILILLVFLLLPNFGNANTDFIGVIGAAVGEITNQNNEKLSNGSKIFLEIPSYQITIQMHRYYFLIKLF